MTSARATSAKAAPVLLIFRAHDVSGFGKRSQGRALSNISNAGGDDERHTSSERTNYFETLPASQLPAGAVAGSDRMRSLV